MILKPNDPILNIKHLTDRIQAVELEARVYNELRMHDWSKKEVCIIDLDDKPRAEESIKVIVNEYTRAGWNAFYSKSNNTIAFKR